MKFMIETSARHIHLTQETVEKLFGAGYQLTKRKDLSYPGQFPCNERVRSGPDRKNLWCGERWKCSLCCNWK